ncbi:hypothetical protein [Mycolicibacterium mageritense]|uniref:hypothetical protein n=1 Tax=Mycolicibacterium mageritense TaxID=53462 RepID=UPI001E428BA4|nr:hypothetical protein [Mycolicibacterium mageritense]
MGSSAPPPEYDDAMAVARARLAALARAREEVAGWRDDDRAAQRRARLFDDLVEEFGRQQETT